jgi:hypothetical protein
MTRSLSLVSTLAAGFSFAHGEQAQLPRKGRQPDPSPVRQLEPARRLPQRTFAEWDVFDPEMALKDYIESQRATIKPPLQSEDRLRPLLRGNFIGLEAIRDKPIRTLPDSRLLPAIAQESAGSVQATPVSNRWRIFPAPIWHRYENTTLDAVYADSHVWDPFNRNTVKADYPVLGRRLFFDLTGSSETLTETRGIPVPANQSSAEPGQFPFFGPGGQFALQQNFRISFDLFRGSAGFRPVDWELRITPEFNINYLLTRETGLTNIDVAQGIRRTDATFGAFQELFIEKRLFTNSGSAFHERRQEDDRGSAYFDFTSLRLGIQRFTSDFRGFVFSDEQPGVRLFGTFDNNVFQYNLAYFNFLEKDTNSGLNRWRSRQQSVSVANLYWNDFLVKGYALNFSVLYNHDQASFLVDKNGFLVRPAPVGSPLPPHKVRAGYVGISGDGHIGRINVSHAFYEAFGRDDRNPITARPEHINAQLGAAEFAYDKDWMTWKVSVFYTSGDRKLNSGQANGFDGIVPNQQFAGGGFLGNPALSDRGLINNEFEAGGINFLNREAVPLSGTALTLFGLNSLIPAMRAGLFEGQANFVNPGILLFNAGFDAKITPKLRSSININYARFNRTEVLEAVLFQSRVRHGIGVDSGLGLQYRPLLSENIVITVGIGTLLPGGGFNDIFDGTDTNKKVLFSGFLNVKLLF